MSIKEKYDRYKITDWITLIIGVVICAIQVIRYYNNLLSDATIELFVSAVWLLLIIAPKTINDAIRKARGLSNNKE